MRSLRHIGIDLLAIITRKKSVTILKMKQFHRAMILAAGAYLILRGIAVVLDKIIEGSHKFLQRLMMFQGIKGSTVSPHQLRHIRKRDLTTGHPFEGSYDTMIAESSSLNHNMLS